MIAGLAVVAWVTDGRGRFTARQEAWSRYTGQTWAAYRGHGWLDAIHPDDRPLLSRRWLPSDTEPPRPHETPVRIWHEGDGEYRQVIISATPVQAPDGRVHEWVGTCLDAKHEALVSDALRGGTESFTRFLALLPVAVFACTKDGRLTYFNRQSTELWNVEPQTGDQIEIFPTASPGIRSSRGRNLFGKNPCECEPVYPVRHALKTGNPVRNERIIVCQSDDAHIDAVVNVTPFFDEHNQVTGAIAAFVDLSNQQAAQDPLRLVNQQLDQHLTARTLEAEHRAVELRKLVHEVTDAEQRERRRIASDLHDHLAQVLAAAKMRIGACAHATPNSDLGEIETLLNDAITQTRSLINELNPVMLEDLGLIPASRWLADEHRTRHNLQVRVIDTINEIQINHSLRILVFHAIRELLGNMAEAEHGGDMTIRFSHMSRRLVVVVDRAGKANTSHNADYVDGSNSSLSHLSKRLDGLGGSVTVNTDDAATYRVTLTIPLGALPDLNEPVLNKQNQFTAAGRSEPQPRHGISILLVDDHKILRDGLREVLEMSSDLIVIGEASDGVEAIEQAALLKPDVVLMDLSMPRLNGIEATRRIKEKMPEVQVVGLSMHEGADSEKAMRDAGASAFLTKGGQTSALIDAVHAAAHSRA